MLANWSSFFCSSSSFMLGIGLRPLCMLYHWATPPPPCFHSHPSLICTLTYSKDDLWESKIVLVPHLHCYTILIQLLSNTPKIKSAFMTMPIPFAPTIPLSPYFAAHDLLSVPKTSQTLSYKGKFVHFSPVLQGPVGKSQDTSWSQYYNWDLTERIHTYIDDPFQYYYIMCTEFPKLIWDRVQISSVNLEWVHIMHSDGSFEGIPSSEFMFLLQ